MKNSKSNQSAEQQAAALITANLELTSQNQEKENKTTELSIVNKKLVLQNEELRAALIIVNKELSFQNTGKDKKAAELAIANKELEFQNREQQSLFAAIVNSSDDAMLSKTLDGIITSWNHGAENIFLYTAREIIGKHISILFPPGFGNEENGIEKKIRNGETVYHYETKRKKKNGEIIDVSLTISPIKDHTGTIVAASKIARDITVRKQAQEKLKKSELHYRSLIEQATDMIYIANSALQYTDINPSGCQMLGYTKEEFCGLVAADLVFEEDVTAHSLKVGEIQAGQAISYRRKMKRKDGSAVEVEANGKMMADGSFIVIARDITEQKKTEEEINMLNRELENRVKERTEDLESFSYSVSHDLRAPLRAVNGFARILEEDYNTLFDDEGKRLLHLVQDNASKMAILIDDLLAFSRLGRKEVNKSSVNMDDLVESILNEIRQTVPYKSEIKLGRLLPIYADKSLIQHVLTNLLSNAIKYSSKQEKSFIEITSRKEKDEVIYAVKDNGVGFDMEYANKLFGVFQRLHSAEEFEGTGVGLAIVHRIIKKHGGKTWAEGKTGEGATFFFSLPDIN